MKVLAIIAIILFSLCVIYAEDDAAPSEKQWVLASAQFPLKQRVSSSDIANSYSTIIPALILEQMAENLKRLPRSQERLDRVLYDLQNKRLALFLQLSKEVRSRDAVVLNNYGKAKLKRKLHEADKKIAAIEKQIDENLSAVKFQKDKMASQIAADAERQKKIEEGEVVDDKQKQDNAFVDFFKSLAGKEREIVEVESVVLYQNDFTKQFDLGEGERDLPHNDYFFEKAVVDAKINGLITGTVSVYGNYVNVSVVLERFPGCVLIAAASDVGTKDDLHLIATTIADKLTPRIADSMNCEVNIAITPDEVADSVTIAIDDVVYPGGTKHVNIPSGVHTITFSQKGYTTESTTYSFEGNRFFDIQVDMKEDKPGTMFLAFNRPLVGSVYANGVLQGETSATQRFTPISINNKQILGHFISEDGVPCDFMIQSKLLADGDTLIANAKPFDRSDYIEKRRKIMYVSYSVLIVSLIPSFLCYGNYAALVWGYNEGDDISLNDVHNWDVARYVTAGVSVAAGVWFIYELVRYLMAANTVLPVNAKKIKPKKDFRIHTFQTYARIQEEQRKLREADEERVRKSIEEAAKGSDAPAEEGNKNGADNLFEPPTQ